ncbi:hypothetical protein WN48_06180 [Eufriesea mexicana]|uniref:Uncharacterized protein n=1 Tax=Eufriesea mexicana TaxID=516756 RepID=A0A310SFC3_9HYME|nr:hypothetical protein WN48_06180 [Eufriesea mexicana]
MVEVLERRAREPTGPIKAPRTYPGPGSPANRVLARLHSQPRLRLRHSYVLFGDDLLISRLRVPLTDFYPPRLQADAGEPAGISANLSIEDTARVDQFDSERLQEVVVVRGVASEASRKHVARADLERGGGEREEARQEASEAIGESDRPRTEEECDEDRVTRVEDKWCWGKVVPLKRGVLTARLEDRSEPRKGSSGRSETGERNVAKRRHGRPCGQQSMDEINGHCPQGEKASRFGLCRCRRFRCSGRCDYRQQRPGAQSSPFYIEQLFSARPRDQLCAVDPSSGLRPNETGFCPR